MKVLVRIHGASINHAHWVYTSGRPLIARLAFGLRRPRNAVRGKDLAGRWRRWVPRGKQRRASWHRMAGRVLVPAGLLAAPSGLWMAVFYGLSPLDGPLLLILRLVVGSAMVVSLILGCRAIRRRHSIRHGEWMTRAYALGIAQGTIVVVTIPWIVLVGPATELTRALLIGVSSVLSLAVAEYVIHRRSRVSRRTS